MRRYGAVLIALALLVTIAACSDVVEPKGQKPGGDPQSGSGGAGPVQRDAIDPVDPPEIEKGVVPDLTHVQALKAPKLIKKAGFTPEYKPLALDFTPGAEVIEVDVICETDPPAGSTPPKKSEVLLIFDIGC